MRPRPETPVPLPLPPAAQVALLPRSRAAAPAVHDLASGRRVHVDGHASTVQITSPEGQIELSVRCTAEGCVLSFAALNLALSTPGKLAVRCAELAVQAERRLELSTEGDYVSSVSGNSSTRVSGRLEAEADELCLSSTRGDALIQANDYVRLVGEKILLNSEHERRPCRDQLEAFWRGLGL